MRSVRRAAIAIVSVSALLVASSSCGGDEEGGGEGGKRVEVFTWWSEGGEKAGLDALVKTFETACSEYKFAKSTISGGAGANAKQVLASRIQQGNPPDTFQAHAGAELNDYVTAGQIQDLSAPYKEWGLTEALPQGLIDNLTVGGKIYSVPANIHRANVVWANKNLLGSVGVTGQPKSLAELFTALEALKAKGIFTPLAVGKDWTQLMLFEAVLISDLGPEKFSGLWKGSTDWNSAEVTKGITDYGRLLSYSNKDRDTLDWTDAEQLIIEGKAGFQLMGDWEAADLQAKNFKDYQYFVFPGNGTAFQWLADSFTLTKDAKDPEGAKCWLKTVGSGDGQKAFNTKKGSIPARADANPSNYPPYQQSAMNDWKAGTQVPSCAHGSACAQGTQGAVNAAIGKFSTDMNASALQQAIAAAVAEANKK